MKGILVYQPPDKPAQLPEFIDSLDPRLRRRSSWQLYQLSKPHKPELREPHFKRFSLERYRDLCELRVKSKMLVRIIFCFCPNGQVLLCMASSNARSVTRCRPWSKPSEYWTHLREHPERAVEYKIKEEERAS